MSRNVKTLAVLFSVALNITLVSVFLVRRGGRTSGPALEARAVRPLYEELGLREAQLETLAPIRDRFHTFVHAQSTKIKTARLELIDLLSRPSPDRAALAAKQTEIQALQREMQSTVIDHLLEESGVLTPEQRRRLFALIRGRLESHDGPRPPWMPRTRAGSASRAHR